MTLEQQKVEFIHATIELQRIIFDVQVAHGTIHLTSWRESSAPLLLRAIDKYEEARNTLIGVADRFIDLVTATYCQPADAVYPRRGN